MSTWETLNKRYIENKYKIFPVVSNGKTPLIKEWQKDCSNDYMQILYWITNAKDCNWGLPATQNDLFILDLDVHDVNKNGVENFDKLLEYLGLIGCGTMVQRTPSGGHHIIYKSDDDLKNVANGSNVFEDYQGIDIRTDGYIVVEPSMINDSMYKFELTGSAQPMPSKLKEYIIEHANKKTDKEKSPYSKPLSVEKGDRDNQLFQYINQLYYKNHLDYDEILILAKYFNDDVLEEPFDDRDVEYKVKKAFEKDRSNCIIIRLPN